MILRCDLTRKLELVVNLDVLVCKIGQIYKLHEFLKFFVVKGHHYFPLREFYRDLEYTVIRHFDNENVILRV
jgi:hypothetical protein